MAEKAFRSCYKDLMKGITDPNDVAVSLYGEGLLTASERDQVMQATQTIDQKNQHLLRFLEARIASDNNVFDKLVEIFENEDAYTSLAKKLKEKRGSECHMYIVRRSQITWVFLGLLAKSRSYMCREIVGNVLDITACKTLSFSSPAPPPLSYSQLRAILPQQKVSHDINDDGVCVCVCVLGRYPK